MHKLLYLIILSCFLFSCQSRQLYDSSNITKEVKNFNIKKNELPEQWRGRKLFLSPYAFIYAADKEVAEEAYDLLEEIALDRLPDKQSQNLGILLVSSPKDKNPALNFNELIQEYEKYLTQPDLLQEDRSSFTKDLDKLKKNSKKITTKKNRIYKKLSSDRTLLNEEKENLGNSMDALSSSTTLFVQPEIVEALLEQPLPEDVLWSAFYSINDSWDENLDDFVADILTASDTSFITRGIIWTLITPYLFVKKSDITELNQKALKTGIEGKNTVEIIELIEE